MTTLALRRLIAAVDNGTWGSEPGEADLDVACVRAADFDFPKLRVDMSRSPTRSVERAVFNRLALRPGDIVLEKSGGGDLAPVGRAVAFESQRPAVTSNFAARVRPAEAVNPRFLVYLLQSLYSSGITLRCIKQTTGIQNLDTEHWLQSRVKRPAVGDQRRIADFLDDRVARIDQIIAARRSHQVARKHLHESQREELLCGPPGVPTVALRRMRCLVQTGPFGSQLHSDEYVDNGWPVVNPACIIDGRLQEIPGMAVDENTRERLSRHILLKDDVVFGRRGEMGRAGLVTEQEVGWVCGTGSLLVRLTDERLRPAFLMQMLSSSQVRHFFQQQSVGSTMDNLNADILLSVPLLLPTVAEQDVILDKVVELDRAVSDSMRSLEASIGLLTEYKQSLITAAVTGDLDVTTAGSGIPG